MQPIPLEYRNFELDQSRNGALWIIVGLLSYLSIVVTLMLIIQFIRWVRGK